VVTEIDPLKRLKLQKLQALEAEAAERAKLPHLYMHKFYRWSREFFDDLESKRMIIVAGNQLSKSTTLIRKFIHTAVTPALWPKLWPHLSEGQLPSQWWYLYPGRDVTTIEFDEKWRPLLPKVAPDCTIYGWRVEKDGTRHLKALKFNSGINIYFKTYKQDVQLLQTGSCYMMGLDEEVPEDLLPELQMRTAATQGYMYFVFTATLGQQFWKEVVEERKRWKEARIWQVSAYDCQTYEDGTPSMWTDAVIKRAVESCVSKAEVDRRIMGRFVKDGGLKYQGFDREKHLKPFHPVPDNWQWFAGLDYGGGGESKHPSAITIVACDEERTKVRVVKHWRGDKIQTTAQDVIDKYLEMVTGLPNITTAFYDWAAVDLGTIAERLGLPFMRGVKSHAVGESAVASLLKARALLFYTHTAECRFPEDHMQMHKIAGEMESLLDGTSKSHAKDDSIDSVRYVVATLVWNWAAISGRVEVTPSSFADPQTELQARRDGYKDERNNQGSQDFEEEFNYWAELYD
jgi:hypothetical protein